MAEGRIDPSGLELKDKVVAINRVAKVVKGGRRFSFTALVVVGDGEGHVGVGLGKAHEVPEAIRKAVEHAKKDLLYVPLRDTTHPLRDHRPLRRGAGVPQPATQGTGVIAGGAVRPVLEAAGVQDVLTKTLGSQQPAQRAEGDAGRAPADHAKLQDLAGGCRRKGLQRSGRRPSVPSRRLKVTLARSSIGLSRRARWRTLQALGLRRIRATVVHDDTPVIRGMIARVPYAVQVEPSRATTPVAGRSRRDPRHRRSAPHEARGSPASARGPEAAQARRPRPRRRATARPRRRGTRGSKARSGGGKGPGFEGGQMPLYRRTAQARLHAPRSASASSPSST